MYVIVRIHLSVSSRLRGLRARVQRTYINNSNNNTNY